MFFIKIYSFYSEFEHEQLDVRINQSPYTRIP